MRVGSGYWITSPTANFSTFPFITFSNLPPNIFDLHAVFAIFSYGSNYWPILQVYHPSLLSKTQGWTLFLLIERQIFFINNQSLKSKRAILWHFPTEKPKHWCFLSHFRSILLNFTSFAIWSFLDGPCNHFFVLKNAPILRSVTIIKFQATSKQLTRWYICHIYITDVSPHVCTAWNSHSCTDFMLQDLVKVLRSNLWLQ